MTNPVSRSIIWSFEWLLGPIEGEKNEGGHGKVYHDFTCFVCFVLLLLLICHTHCNIFHCADWTKARRTDFCHEYRTRSSNTSQNIGLSINNKFLSTFRLIFLHIVTCCISICDRILSSSLFFSLNYCVVIDKVLLIWKFI